MRALTNRALGKNASNAYTGTMAADTPLKTASLVSPPNSCKVAVPDVAAAAAAAEAAGIAAASTAAATGADRGRVLPAATAMGWWAVNAWH